jgi:hypothetical protein
MITLNPPVPEVPATMESLSNLLGLLSDPNASKARVAELSTASAALQKAISDQKAATAAFSIASADHKAEIDQREADSAASLSAARAKFDDECQRRSAELSAREANVALLEAKAADDAKAAAALRADLDRRLKIIRSATG